MKDFMFIFKGGGIQYDFSPEEMQQHMQKWFSWIEELKAKQERQATGHLGITGADVFSGIAFRQPDRRKQLHYSVAATGPQHLEYCTYSKRLPIFGNVVAGR